MWPNRGISSVLVSLALVLAVPVSAQAAVTIGRANPSNPGAGGTCDPANAYTQLGTTGVVVAAAPTAGVITSWSTRANSQGGQQAALKTLRQAGAGAGVTFTVLGSSETQTLTPGILNRFAARIPIGAGEKIGYYSVSGSDDSQACIYDGQQTQNEVAAGPSSGQIGTAFANPDGSSQKLLNLEATLEPDADGDGYGDETQDRCLGRTGALAGCPAGTLPTRPGAGVDTVNPTLGRLTMSRNSFAAASSGAAVTSQRRRRKPTVGTRVAFNLSEAGAVRFTVERKGSGRRVSSRCRKRTKSNRRKPRCTRWTKVRGAFTVNAKAGRNTMTFRGRVGGRKLRTGSYRLVGTATDAAKNASRPANKQFKIVK